MTETIKDFVSTFKKPKPIKTFADEIKRLNKKKKYKMYYENMEYRNAGT